MAPTSTAVRATPIGVTPVLFAVAGFAGTSLVLRVIETPVLTFAMYRLWIGGPHLSIDGDRGGPLLLDERVGWLEVVGGLFVAACLALVLLHALKRGIVEVAPTAEIAPP